MDKTLTFLQALRLLSQEIPVQCTVKGGDPVIYAVIDDELTLITNGQRKVYNIRDFCFSPTQILFGKWERRADRG